MADQKKTLLEHLDAVLLSYEPLRLKTERHEEIWGVEASAFITAARAVIERVAGRNSSYGREADVQRQFESGDVWALAGIVRTLREDVAADRLASMAEIIHAEVFSDMLDMADHLEERNYLLAATVIGGAALEGHLRQLCTKNGIPLETLKGSDMVPKSAAELAVELHKGPHILPQDHSSITGWLKKRNLAAHNSPDFAKLTSAEIRLYLSGIRDFINRTPA